ncbi:hypothetical protein SAMN05880501_104257 [Ureibacillus xyleni]|uniref:Uncharacterized protein n=1 Tax=Ureibacillus xyleni TaxID=614648 RepID=A0A285SER6_9BACL|nr:hypothetical protein [Ureibacillus xyleni]SOC06356.1 hypothetical protein SAMN05880501_104257 [Ureibacillus xyleni]
MKKNHKPTGRQFWESYVELHCHQPSSTILEVNVGADDPTLLQLPEALTFASKIAKKKKFNTLVEIENDIRLYGQNHLAERKYFFKK